MLRPLCVLLSALSASVLATKKSCAPLHIPRGKCWTDSKHRIETFPHSPNATFCCDRCQALQGCQVLAMASCPLCYTSSHALARNDVFIDTTYQSNQVWVHWMSNATTKQFSCYLYSAPKDPVPCAGHHNYTAGWSTPVVPPAPGPSPTPAPYVPPYPTPAGAKDVIMIAVDDMRPELGSYGCDHMHTPHMDALAADSLSFDNAYVAVAWCSPSRTALLTSRRPDTTMTWSVVPKEYWRQRGGNFSTSVCCEWRWRGNRKIVSIKF